MSLPGRDSICPYRGRLEALRDDAVPPEERQRIEAHLRDCAACRQHWNELQSLARVLEAYRTPAGGWSSDAEFWGNLAPQLRPRTTATQPPPFLAPIGVLVSSLALRGFATSVVILYGLYQWQVLPAWLSTALASAARLALGPLVWQAGQSIYNSLGTSLTSAFAASGRLWLLAFEATVAALLLLLSGVHIGWLLRWLRGQGALPNALRTE